ncbi:hypothetical protein Tco_0505592, partial [Tanacetum coccineum]
LFDTMMVQASEEVGEDSDHPTDSTQIPIIDQPSSSSQPKKKQPSKKAQRQEAEVPQDETEHEESLDLEKAKDAQAKEVAAMKKRIQRLERKKISRPIGLKRLKKVGMYRRVESSKDQESLGAPADASKQGRSIADLDADVERHVKQKLNEKDEQNQIALDEQIARDIQAKLDAKLIEEQKLARKQEEEANIALIKL